MHASNCQQPIASPTSGRGGRSFAGGSIRFVALIGVLLATGLFAGGLSATVVFDNYVGRSNVPPNPPSPNYQNFAPRSDPNYSVDQLQNLINFAAGGTGNIASSGTAPNIDWDQSTNTLCNNNTNIPNYATAEASCVAWLQGRVTYALIKFPAAGTYAFAAAHDDETQIGFASELTPANAGNYRNFNYNVPVGTFSSYTAGDNSFQTLPGNFQIAQANTCYVMRVYWNNQQGINDLHLRWTVPGGATAIVPASALFDPGVAANYSTCATAGQDFGIAKTGPATFVPGSAITYTITVWNYGGGDAAAAHFSDTLPASLSNITFSCAARGAAVCGSSTHNGSAYAVTTGALPVNNSAGNASTPPTTGSFLTYTVTATPSDVATIVNTATITDNDTNGANNTASTTSTAASHDNTLTKLWSGATAGDAVTLNITGTGVTSATAGRSSAPSTTTTATATANVNTTINLVEAFTTGRAAEYATTLACVKNTDRTALTVTGTGLSRSVVVPADSGVACTYTNTLTTNVAVAKSGPATAGIGSSYNYTLAVTNNGGVATGTNVIVQDRLPAGEAATASTNATCAPLNRAGALLTCTIPGPIAATASVSVGLTVTAPATAGVITNYAATNPAGTGNPASRPGAACNTTTTSCSSAVTTVQAPVLTLSKTHAGNFTVGVNGVYTLTVGNGSAADTGATTGTVTVSDTLPTGLTYVSAAGSGWICSAAGQVVTCTSAAVIAAGASAPPIALTVGVAASAIPSVTNSANVRGGGDSTCPSNARCAPTDPTTVNTAANVSVSKTGPATVVAGSSYTYTLDVANSGGTATGTGVIVQDQLPPGEVATASTNATCAPLNSAGALLTCTLSSPIAANATASATLTVTAPATAGAISNYAATNPAGSGDPPSHPGAACNTTTTSCSSAATTVNTAANVSVSKTGPSTVLTGSSYTYTLAVANSGGTATGTGVIVQDQLPPGEVATASTNATCAPLGSAGALLTCTLSSPIAANATASATLTVTAPATAGAISNYAATNPAGSGDPPSHPGAACNTTTTSCSSAATTVNTAANVSVSKTGPSTVLTGSSYTYTLAVANSGGTATGTGVIVQDQLPPGEVATASTNATCAPLNSAGALLTCSVSGPIAANATVSVGLTVTAPATSGAITNYAATNPAGSGNPASNPGAACNATTTSCSSVPTTVNTAAKVSVSKTGPATAMAGSSYAYTLAVTNNGGSATGAGVIVQDQLPAGELATASTNATCTPLDSAGALLTCTLSNAIAANATTSVGLTVTAPATSGAIINYAATNPAGSGNPPTAPGAACNTATTNCASAATTVQAPVLNLSKTHTGNLTVGVDGLYTLTVSNGGSAPTTGTVTISDTLPTGLGYVSAAGTAWACAATAQVVTCSSTSAIAAGASAPAITLTVSVAAAAIPSVTNTATASGGGDGACPAAAHCKASDPTAVGGSASLTLKETATVTDTNGDGVVGDAGDVIAYAFAVTNTGNVPLTDVKVTDPLLPGLSCIVATLAVDATTTCAPTGNTYTITAADVTAGHVNSAATATATPPGNLTPPTGSSSVSTPTTAGVASLTLKKTATMADTNGDLVPGDAGDTITYAFAVTNNGTVALAHVIVTDALLPNLSCGVATLAVGATTTCAATGNTYIITANDAAAGHVNNTADATGTPPSGANIKSPTAIGTATAQTAATPTASLTLQEVATVADTNADAVLGDAGDTISYTFSATNTGTTELTDVTVSDPRLPNLVCAIGTLQAGASGSCAATGNTYAITATDATAGKVDNTATVTGKPPGNLAPPTASATVSTPTKVGNSAVTLSKQAAQRDVNIGDLVRYTVIATATGNAAARDATLIDTPPAGFSYVQGSLSVADADKSGTLSGTDPIRVTGVNIGAGSSATITYFLRVGAGVGKGVHINQAVVDDASGKTLSNVASAEVELTSDPLLDDSLIIGTVFDDRNGDGWQDPARAGDVHVHGGFASDVYTANSTTVDKGDGPRPQADHGAPLLHGLSLGTIGGRSSTADTAERHQVIVGQRLRLPRFTDDFVLTTGEGTTVRMNAAGQTTIERRGDARKGLTGQDIAVERRVSRADGGYQVDYVIRDNGIEERGIPGVRVVSVEGLVMETDAYGRFNLQGIDGGEWARGRNFILKVDPATLPPGSVFTTENPRVVRITPGVPARFDFGVKLPAGEIEGGHAEIDIALGEVLFAAGSAEVKPDYASVLDRMAGKLRQYHGGSLTITATAGQQGLAFARARAVQAALEQRLDSATRSRLQINVSVAGDASPLVSLGPSVHLVTLLFDTDKASIKPAYRALIRSIAEMLDEKGGGVITLVGRADRRGTDAYNTQLGLERARAVYDAIAADLKPERRAKVRVEVSDDPNAPLGVDKR